MNDSEEQQETPPKRKAKARADGEGSVWKLWKPRGKALYGASHSIWETDPETGQRKRAFVRGYGQTREQAIARRAKNYQKRISGATKPRSRDTSPTLNAYVETYMASKATEISPETWRKTRRDFELHILPHLGKQKINKITEEQLNNLFYETIKDAGTSARMNAYKNLNALFNFALKRRVINENPLQYVIRPKHLQTKTLANDKKWINKRMSIAKYMLKWLQTEEAGEWQELYPRVSFMFLGLRRAELLGLEWDSVNQLTKRGKANIVVDRQLKRHEKHTGKSGWYIEKRVKTDSSVRTIYLPEPYRQALLQQKKKKLVAKEDWQKDLVFLSNKGTHISYNTFDRQWRKMLLDYMNRDGKQRTKLNDSEYFRPHASRNITASILFDQGVSPEQAKEILGHSDAIMTLYYTHFTRQQRKDSTNKLATGLFDEEMAKLPEETTE